MDFVSIEDFELYGHELSELLRTEYAKKLRFKRNRSINLKH